MAANPMTVDKAYLIGFILETILYGIHIVLSGMAVTLLTWRRGTQDIRKFILVISIVLFLASTVHFAFGFYDILEIFIVRREEPGGPAYIVNQPSFTVRIDAMFCANNFLGDAILIYRCWIVWGKYWLVLLLPLATLIAYTLLAAIGLHHQVLLVGSQLGGRAPEFMSSVMAYGTSSFVMSLALNFIVTGLIASRVYLALRAGRVFSFPSPHAQQYYSIIAMIVESGAIFCAAQVVFVALWCLRSDAHWIGMNPAAQIYCLVPQSIIVRVALGITSEQTTFTAGNTRSKETTVHSTDPELGQCRQSIDTVDQSLVTDSDSIDQRRPVHRAIDVSFREMPIHDSKTCISLNSVHSISSANNVL